MKKNLMSVLILALVLVNLILTGILTITILPQTKKSNELVNKVCSAIDLELESGDGTESASIPMDQIVTYKIEDAMTINLKTGADGETHYVKLTASISMDSKNDGYKTYGEDMADRETILKDTINSVINTYTMDEFNADRQAVKEAVWFRFYHCSQLLGSNCSIGLKIVSMKYKVVRVRERSFISE